MDNEEQEVVSLTDFRQGGGADGEESGYGEEAKDDVAVADAFQ